MSISELLFLLVLGTLPLQLGKFFFFEHSYVLGIPIDYRAVTIYISDIATITFLASTIYQNRKNLQSILVTYKDYVLAIGVFNLYLALTAIFFSVSPGASFFFTLKFFIFSLLSIAAASILGKKTVREKAAIVLAVSIFWQSLVVVGQFLRQGSLGLQILGERTFDASTVQIAHSQIFGQQFLRPYGTFPHPNVAAAFLVFSLLILAGSPKGRLQIKKIALLAIAALATFLTFSKSAFVVFALGLALLQKGLSKLILLATAALLFGFFIVSQLSIYQIASIAERLLLSQAALDIALENMVFGVGANNFILELGRLDLFSLAETRLLQPVHNVFLLILAENGIVGLMLFTALLLVVSKYLNSKVKIVVFLGLLFYLSVDHFLWTLQQGQLIFWLILAYIIHREKPAI